MRLSIKTASMFIFGICIVAILCSVVVNLWTITTFPSWFDEAFMANISINVASGKGRYLDLIPGYFTGEVNLYGPIYFHLQAFFIRLYGLHAFLFRLPNLVSGYIAIVALAFSLAFLGLPRRAIILFLLASSLDVSLNRNIVSGRMDMVALALVSSSLSLGLARVPSLRLDYIRWFCVGLFSSIAFLTTPRSLFLLPVVLAVSIPGIYYSNYRKDKFITAAISLVAILAFALPVFMWITSIGGPAAYIASFAGNTVAMRHISPSFFRSFYDNVAIAIFIFLVLANLPLVRSNALIIGIVVNYVAFSVFVKEVGPYAGMITPFLIFGIFIFLYNGRSAKILRYMCFLPLLIPGAFLIGVRSIDLIVNSKCRDPHAFIAAYRTIEADLGDSLLQVVSPFKYYFFLESSRYSLVTLEFSSVKPREIFESSDIVVLDESSKLNYSLTSGYKKANVRKCKALRIPPLTSQFAEKSSFNEDIYFR